MEIKSIINKVSLWLKKNQADIILFLGVLLVSLLSFAMGYIMAKEELKDDIKIEETTYEQLQDSHNRSGDFGPLSCLEII